ncbi:MULTISPECIES: DUF624 domain-containing protein [unclassified Enterococcus]|uniref:DUF624 domain-containing protein n=1 Tax=unclassified Enterococcus TaxID=2608891 RepID=UPI001556D434|nr:MULTISPECIES: DUF624 domain-containing protein [unclassified Enterococcus]MBS7577670.1 DUF624 domain-containing protein [Enterococcus sp. MMGLQ5-2]MBS7584136.1 DUF624 domain-containing protein [Enterococcus sp. MMGLQ5-1]NPD11994.1 DUF624 domain-containing protein [Enterococcus sp. MMGLQ5-1]NPD37503.1 DUF624 domain-containing protein [Enterococcus sp. MMGLQ5-2]
MFRFKNQTYDNNIYMKWIYYLYCGLMMNLGLLILNLPFFGVANFLAIAPENLGIFVLSTILFYPAIIIIFAAMDHYRIYGEIESFKFFFQIGLKKYGLKGFKYGICLTLMLFITISDALLFYHLPFAKITVPFFILLSVLAIAFTINLLYFRVRNYTASLKDIMRISIYYLLRKWYVSLLNLGLFFSMMALMILKPQFGFILTPVLFIGTIFLNCSKLHQQK